MSSNSLSDSKKKKNKDKDKIEILEKELRKGKKGNKALPIDRLNIRSRVVKD